MKNIFFAALFAAFLTSAPLAAGELAPDTDTRLAFKYLSVNDGLSQNSVTSILQSSDGRMLIGTYDGLNFFDGYAIRPVGVTVLERGEESAKIRMTIHEGRNRQIRRMCEKAGLEVRRLKRVAIGNMPLDPKLKSGAWRELTQDELAYLQDLCAGIEE